MYLIHCYKPNPKPSVIVLNLLQITDWISQLKCGDLNSLGSLKGLLGHFAMKTYSQSNLSC